VSLEGKLLGKPDIHSYEFKSVQEKTGLAGFTYNGARKWLEEHSVDYMELRPAYDLMLFEIWKGGLVYYGGVLGAVIAAVFFALRRKIHFWKLGDICAPSVAVGLAMGRIGCFLNGCCWGKVAEDFPCAITFPKGSPAFQEYPDLTAMAAGHYHSLPVYPTQLMHHFLALTLAVIIWLFGKSRFKRNHGEEILLFGILYPWARFAVEFYRGDHKEHYLFNTLTISQSVGIFVFVACLVIFILRRRKGWGRIEPEPVAGKAASGDAK
jgi:phosphatidylglycerol:prolipoprotein diacylglycerol transferase